MSETPPSAEQPLTATADRITADIIADLTLLPFIDLLLLLFFRNCHCSHNFSVFCIDNNIFLFCLSTHPTKSAYKTAKFADLNLVIIHIHTIKYKTHLFCRSDFQKTQTVTYAICIQIVVYYPFATNTIASARIILCPTFPVFLCAVLLLTATKSAVYQL